MKTTRTKRSGGPEVAMFVRIPKVLSDCVSGDCETVKKKGIRVTKDVAIARILKPHCSQPKSKRLGVITSE